MIRKEIAEDTETVIVNNLKRKITEMKYEIDQLSQSLELLKRHRTNEALMFNSFTRKVNRNKGYGFVFRSSVQQFARNSLIFRN